MRDKRNIKLSKMIMGLPEFDRISLLAFLTGFEHDCKHFHDGIESWFNTFQPELLKEEEK